jgi:hypothetical protein
VHGRSCHHSGMWTDGPAVTVVVSARSGQNVYIVHGPCSSPCRCGFDVATSVWASPVGTASISWPRIRDFTARLSEKPYGVNQHEGLTGPADDELPRLTGRRAPELPGRPDVSTVVDAAMAMIMNAYMASHSPLTTVAGG